MRGFGSQEEHRMNVDDLRRNAGELDSLSPLAHLRTRFELPEGIVYLNGNSLGALPTGARGIAQDVIERQWGTDLISSWNDNGWWDAPVRIGDRVAGLVGAAPGQVVVGDSTSVNLFKAFSAAVRLRPGRHLIVTDRESFPTDLYIAESVAELADWQVVRLDPPDMADFLTERGDEAGRDRKRTG